MNENTTTVKLMAEEFLSKERAAIVAYLRKESDRRRSKYETDKNEPLRDIEAIIIMTLIGTADEIERGEHLK